MPVYNAEKFLKEAIDSIVNQTYDDWELIVVNDGSTDESENLILSYADSRIKYSKNDGNKGIVYTRNKMIYMAKGEYIAFLDSDDIAMPERLKQQVDFLDFNPEYAMCGAWGIMIDERGEQIKKINLATQDADIRYSLLFASTFIQSSVMIRKQVLRENSYNEEYPVAEDYDLWCRLSRKYKLKNIAVHLTKYRWHGDNISQEKKALMDDVIKKIYKSQLSYLGVEASDRELLLHAAMRDKSLLNLSVNEYLAELKPWLRKIATVKNDKMTDKLTLRTIVDFRWIYACKEWGSKLQMLLPPIHLNPKGWALLARLLNERFQ